MSNTDHCRNNAEQERKKKQHTLRVQWEEERSERERAKTELEKEYRKQLSDKRRKETDFCRRRVEQARDRFIRSQAHLRQLLKEKDDRNKVLLDTIAKQKVSKFIFFNQSCFILISGSIAERASRTRRVEETGSGLCSEGSADQGHSVQE